MVLLDMLGRRWALRVLWELRHGPLNFRQLRSACDDASPSVLNRRLSELRELTVVEHGERGYQLTTEGERLGALLLPLDAWARKTARRWGDADS
ncbi:MAG: helix-turn-helix domain-containing protein [Myxococcota bacterium]